MRVWVLEPETGLVKVNSLFTLSIDVTTVFGRKIIGDSLVILTISSLSKISANVLPELVTVTFVITLLPAVAVPVI